METAKIHYTDMEVSRIALGTWAIGGWMWGGTDENESILTIRAALDKGINLIDTAPVYGFGRSEEIVGKAVKEHGGRDRLAISTKAALEWRDGKVFRNSTPERIRKEIVDSLERLQTDYIDIYHIHWPDPLVPFEQTAETMERLFDEGKIRAVAVSNYNPRQMEAFAKAAPLHLCQPPYNLFERQIEENGVKEHCKRRRIVLTTYGALCRGLLSGKMSEERKFEGDDLRRFDPKFQGERFVQYLAAAEKLRDFARDNYGKSLLALAVRWVLDQGIDIALWGGRRPDQMAPVDEIMGWRMDEDGLQEVERIVRETVSDPVGPEFMAPPGRDG